MTDDLVVAGTVFRLVLVWEISTGSVLRRLKGHQGVIFDVLITPDLVASVSDDRTLRVWKHNSDQEQIFFGHTARIWKVQ